MRFAAYLTSGLLVASQVLSGCGSEGVEEIAGTGGSAGSTGTGGSAGSAGVGGSGGIGGSDSGGSGGDAGSSGAGGAGGSVSKAFSPGHWIGGGSAVQFAVDHSDSFVGALIQLRWNEIEDAAPGVYDWSAIEAAIAKLKPKGLKLAVFLHDKNFGAAARPTPSYMIGDPKYEMDGWVNCLDDVKHNYHSYSAIWDPDVNERWVALFKAASERFGHEPTVEMLLTSETSYRPACLDSHPDYTPQRLEEALYQYTEEITWELRSSHIVFNKGMNYSPYAQEVIEGLCERSRQRGGAVGGPDIKADKTLASETRCFQPMNNGVGVANELAIAVQVQKENFSDHGTLQDVWDKATGPKINANIIFWYKIYGTSYTIDDVIARINGDKTRGVETLRPNNLHPGFPYPW